ncbi:dUTP diphosphatase [Candidatus Woesearchaeota archaeon]|nr:dUTP diphosphatase [Candidatus Woesearchaeota archaeon]
MKIKIKKLSKDAKLPSYAHEGDAGLDLYSDEDFILKVCERAAIKTGVQIAIPNGYVGLVWDKSGIALNHGIKTKGGVIDSSYRGEVKVVMVNLGKEDFMIKKGMKIAQMLVQKVEKAELEEAEALDETARNEKGFGSTGL